jgi:hypothetical protein
MTRRSEVDPRNGAAILYGAAGWGRLQEALCRALSHHLNGRANALSGLVEMVERGSGDDEINQLLRSEVDRVSRVAGLIRAVVGEVGVEEVRVLSELTTDVLTLTGLLQITPPHEPERLGLEADSAVRTDGILLGRLLLLLRNHLDGRCADDSVRLQVGEDGPHAFVEMCGTADPDTDARVQLGVTWEELARASRAVPGVVELTRSGASEPCYRLTLRRLE